MFLKNHENFWKFCKICGNCLGNYFKQDKNHQRFIKIVKIVQVKIVKISPKLVKKYYGQKIIKIIEYIVESVEIYHKNQ